MAIYFLTGTFGAPWFLVSLGVYAALFVAVVVALVGEETPTPHAAAAPLRPPRMLKREVLYETAHGMVVQVSYLHADGELERQLFTFTQEESNRIHEVEAHVDALPETKTLDLSGLDEAILLQAKPLATTPGANPA